MQLLLLSSLAFAQSADRQHVFGFQQEFFFGNAPHARNEALARAGVTLGGGTSSAFYNPASLGLVEEGNVMLSHSAPYYVLTGSNYLYAGASYRVLGPWVVGLAMNRFTVGPTTFTVDIGGVDYPIDVGSTTHLTLTNAVEVLPGLNVGVNVNAFLWKLFDDVPAGFGPNVDAGLHYRLALPGMPAGEHGLRAGASVTNVALQGVRYAAPDGFEAQNTFPTVMRLGVAYEAGWTVGLPGAGEGPLTVLGLVELQEVLNSPFRTAVQAAAEVGVYDVVAFRVGGYTESQDDFGVDNNRARVWDLTYGFGVRIPIDELTDGRAPIRVALDYTAIEPAPVVFRGTRLPNRSTITLGVDWAVPEGAP